jgi:membrane associated rhomboid family serine protease
MSEFRPPGFSILPLVVKNLIIINGLIFLGQLTMQGMGSRWMEATFALHDVRSYYFRPHQLITYMFLHGGGWHIFMNMFAVWMFGSTLENMWGPKRFLVFYVLCGIGAGLLHLGVLYLDNNEWIEVIQNSSRENEVINAYQNLNQATLGASGAVFGCLAAFGYLFPNSMVYVYFFPMRAKWFVLLYAGFELFSGLRNSAGDNVAHWAHLGGALVGFLLVLFWNRTNRRNFY